jgi:hypothetical protein
MATQVKAAIVVAQATTSPPGGYVSGSRDDLVLGQLVTCTNRNDTGVTGWTWTLRQATGQLLASYSFSGSAGASCTFTPPASTGYGDCSLTLKVYGDPLPGGAQNTAQTTVILGIRAPNATYTRGIPIPSPDEGALTAPGQAGGSNTVDPTVGAAGRQSEAILALTKAIAAAGGAIVQDTWRIGLSGFYDGAYPLPGRLGERVKLGQSRTLTSVRLVRGSAGASGSTTVNVTKNGTTVFSVAPTVTSASGADAASTGTLSTSAFASGDVVEVTLTAVETALLSSGVQIGPESIYVELNWSIP